MAAPLPARHVRQRNAEAAQHVFGFFVYLRQRPRAAAAAADALQRADIDDGGADLLDQIGEIWQAARHGGGLRLRRLVRQQGQGGSADNGGGGQRYGAALLNDSGQHGLEFSLQKSGGNDERGNGAAAARKVA